MLVFLNTGFNFVEIVFNDHKCIKFLCLPFKIWIAVFFAILQFPMYVHPDFPTKSFPLL